MSIRTITISEDFVFLGNEIPFDFKGVRAKNKKSEIIQK